MRVIGNVMPRVPKRIVHNGVSAFLDVPAYALADAGKALTVNPTGDGFVYAAFAAAIHVHAGEDITSGTVADARIAAILTGKTLITPTIASFVNAQHNHSNAAGGGTISGGGGTPGGADTQVQFNDGGVFGGDAGLVYNKTTDVLTGTGSLVIGRVGVGVTPTSPLEINYSDSSGLSTVVLKNTSTGNNAFTEFRVSTAAQAFMATFGAAGAGVAVNGGVFDGGFTYFNAGGGSNGINIASAKGTGIVKIFTGGVLAANERMRIQYDGLVAIGGTTATALLHLAASTSARAQFNLTPGVLPTTLNDGDVVNDGNAIVWRVNGTNAVNTDGGLSVWMQSASQARNVGRLLWQYTDKTDATRKTQGAVTAFDAGTEYKAIRWGANGGALLSFYDIVTPIARQVLATGAGATVDNVIAVLQNLGLVKQS